ncbi:TPA: gamma-glutamyl-gamma-aminobutyrate hydrolase family protein [Legionella anisa]
MISLAELTDLLANDTASNVLDLSNKNLTTAEVNNYIIPFLKEHPEITELNLSNNNIDENGARILLESKLRKLNLSRNKLGEMSPFTINKNITRLDLSDNSITETDFQELLKSNLEALNLSHCGLSDPADDALLEYTKIKILELNQNYLTDSSIERVMNNLNIVGFNVVYQKNPIEIQFRNDPRLFYYDEWNDFYQYGPDKNPKNDFFNLLKNYSETEEGETLNLAHLRITNSDVVMHLIPFLKQHPKITAVDMSGNEIDAEGANALMQLNNIIQLNLSNNRIGLEQEAISLEMQANLKRLNLSGNSIKANNIKELLLNSNLEALNLRNCNISDLDETWLSSTTIKVLDLSGNKLRTHSAELLRLNSRISKINLDDQETPIKILFDDERVFCSKNWNTFYKHGLTLENENSARLLDLLKNYNNETTLRLVDLNLTNASIFAYIIPFLKQHPEITRVDLSRNLIDGKGAQALMGLDSIIKLNLSENRIGSEMSSCRAHPKLERLNLSGNWMRNVDLTDLVLNSNLKVLSLANCGIKDANEQLVLKTKIQGLDLSSNPLSPITILELLAVPSCLKLHLDENQLTPPIIDILATRKQSFHPADWDSNELFDDEIDCSKPLVVLLFYPKDGVNNTLRLIEFFQKQDLNVVLVNPGKDNIHHPIFATPEKIHGLILPGGPDVPEDNNDLRKSFEIFLLKFAREQKIPTLGVCRGHQFIASQFGAAIKNLEESIREHSSGAENTIRVKDKKDSILYQRLERKGKKFQDPQSLNNLIKESDKSFTYRSICHHHQAVFFQSRDKAKVKIIARGKDKTIEALQIENHILTYQHHHEGFLAANPNDRIAKALLKLFKEMTISFKEKQEAQEKLESIPTENSFSVL